LQIAVARIDDYDDYYCLECEAEHEDVSRFLGNVCAFDKTNRGHLPQDGNFQKL